MEEFCADHDAVLVPPVNETAEHIIQVGESGFLELLPTKGMRGLKTRAMNSRTYCNMERKGVECGHGGMKQDKFWMQYG